MKSAAAYLIDHREYLLAQTPVSESARRELRRTVAELNAHILDLEAKSILRIVHRTPLEERIGA